jgi:hypothetical protein
MLPTQEAYVRVQNLGVSVDAADALLARFKYENAVTGYQDFGGQGVAFGSDLNPQDLSVIQAAALNAQLQSLVSHLASQQTATQAQSLAHQMLTLYQAAYNVAPNTPTPAGPVVVVPAATAASTIGKTVATVALWSFVAVGLGVMGWMLWKAPPMWRPHENPSGGSKKASGTSSSIARGTSSSIARGTSKSARGAPIVKGRACRFEMKDGPDVSCAGAMIHDPSGRHWPKNSVLCGPFRARVRRASDDEYRGAARDYLGTTHQASVGVVQMPPRSLGEWTYVGEVDRIFYTRTGRKRPGRYQHPFFKPTALATLVRGRRGKVRLYRRGQFCRLELPRGAQLDNRGYVYP